MTDLNSRQDLRAQPWSNAPRVVQVIESQVTRGCGVTYCTEGHVHESIRTVTQYHTLEGEFLAERDPVAALNNVGWIANG